jgi:hypothetical protein
MKSQSQDAYQQKMLIILAKIESLKSALVLHEEVAKDAGLNWGFVGDLSEVESQLDDIIRFIEPFEMD